MKWIKIFTAVGVVLLLSLACASIGGGTLTRRRIKRKTTEPTSMNQGKPG